MRSIPTILLLATAAAAQDPLPEKVTFTEHIAPLVHKSCTMCHRPGQAGPFSLITYKDVHKRARMLEQVMKDRYMPPWHPVKGHGEFKNERRLSDQQVAMFSKWIEQGKPNGDPSKMPELPQYPSGWFLGKPDMVLEMKEPFEVPADGRDLYRSFVFPINQPEDKWVTAVELRPSARSVLHHALFFLVDNQDTRGLRSRDGKPGVRGMRFRPVGRLGGYVPGAMPEHMPEGLALHIPAGTDLVMQTHFHPSGKREFEKSKIALYFTDKAPTKRFSSIQLPPLFGVGKRINIPAGEKNYKVEDQFKLPVPVTAYAVGGHAHYILQRMKMTAELPNGQTQPLLYIDDWDLDWQGRYWFKKPIELPAGTVVKTELIYDNSAENPDNPNNPPKRIRWGRESTDEMGSVTLRVISKEDDRRVLRNALRSKQREGLLGRFSRRGGGGRGRGFDISSWLERMDRNKDGKLTRDEVNRRMRDRLFADNVDKNGDGVLDQEEQRAAIRSFGGETQPKKTPPKKIEPAKKPKKKGRIL